MHSDSQRHRKRLPYTPTIFRKGLILILIPGVLGSCFLLVLNQLWIGTGRLAVKEQEGCEVVTQLNDCFSGLASYCFDLVSYCFTNDPKSKERSLGDREDVLRTVSGLRTLKTDESVRESVKQLQELFLSIMADADRLAPSLMESHFSNSIQRISSYAHIMLRGNSLADRMQKFVEQETSKLEISRRKEEQQFLDIRTFVFAAFACGTLTVAALLIVFARGTIVRLRILACNAATLAKLTKPAVRVHGNDELAYLDSVFNQAADELRNAGEHRRSVMQMVAHDMRSPIMATIVYLQVFEELTEQTLSEKAALACQTTQNACNSILAFVTDLLTLEKLESGNVAMELSQFSLWDAAAECVAELSGLAHGKSVTVRNDCIYQAVTADRERITQVIMNLLANAIKIAPSGSTVVLNSEITEEYTRFSVRHCGQELLPSQSQLGSDRPQQAGTGGQSSSFGLGLSFCKSIVEAHGGSVGSSPVSGNGSQLWFRIPRDPSFALAAQTNKQGADPGGSDGNPKGILSHLFRPRVFQMALILAVFPIAVQFAWLIWMNDQLQQAERLADLIHRQTEIVMNVNVLWASTFRANYGVAFFLVTQKPSFGNLAIKNLNEAADKLRVLESLMSDNPRNQTLLSEMKEFLQPETLRLHSMLATPQQADDASFGLSVLPRELYGVQYLNARIQGMAEEERLSLSNLRSQQDQFCNQVQHIIFLAVALNLLMSLFLLWFFTVGIMRRLNVLVDLARMLPSREPITLSVTGSDEIHLLYSLLCQAAADLKASDEQRNSLMSMVAQDIRTPLVTIEASLSLLETACPPDTPGQARESLASAKLNIGRLVALTNDLLTVDSFKVGKIDLERRDCQLKEIVNEAVASTAGLAQQKNISLKTACPEIIFSLDQGRMVQVLINLLTNAIKFSPEGSTVDIEATKTEAGIELSVKDSGPGMNEETVSRIFDKFFRSQNQNEPGFGLGLTICKLIVESHGGTLKVESQPGKGSTFSVSLPSVATGA